MSDRSIKLFYDTNGNVKCRIWYFRGKVHNLHDPARITYYPSGNVQSHMFYTYGAKNISSKPVKIEYYDVPENESGELYTCVYDPKKFIIKQKVRRIEYIEGIYRIIKYYNFNQSLHRDEDKPAYSIIYNKYYSTEHYYINGKLHRENDKPSTWCYMCRQIYMEFRQYGILHRNLGPAYISFLPERKTIWYNNGNIIDDVTKYITKYIDEAMYEIDQYDCNLSYIIAEYYYS